MGTIGSNLGNGIFFSTAFPMSLLYIACNNEINGSEKLEVYYKNTNGNCVLHCT